MRTKMLTTYTKLGYFSRWFFRSYFPIEHIARRHSSFGPKLSKRLEYLYRWHRKLPATSDMSYLDVLHLHLLDPSFHKDRSMYWSYRCWSKKYMIEQGLGYMQIWVTPNMTPAECANIINSLYVKIRLSVMLGKGRL